MTPYFKVIDSDSPIVIPETVTVKEGPFVTVFNNGVYKTHRRVEKVASKEFGPIFNWTEEPTTLTRFSQDYFLTGAHNRSIRCNGPTRAGSGEPNLALYLGDDNHPITFHPGIVYLLGDEGTGKTHIIGDVGHVIKWREPGEYAWSKTFTEVVAEILETPARVIGVDSVSLQFLEAQDGAGASKGGYVLAPLFSLGTLDQLARWMGITVVLLGNFGDYTRDYLREFAGRSMGTILIEAPNRLHHDSGSRTLLVTSRTYAKRQYFSHNYEIPIHRASDAELYDDNESSSYYVRGGF